MRRQIITIPTYDAGARGLSGTQLCLTSVTSRQVGTQVAMKPLAFHEDSKQRISIGIKNLRFEKRYNLNLSNSRQVGSRYINSPIVHASRIPIRRYGRYLSTFFFLLLWPRLPQFCQQVTYFHNGLKGLVKVSWILESFRGSSGSSLSHKNYTLCDAR